MAISFTFTDAGVTIKATGVERRAMRAKCSTREDRESIVREWLRSFFPDWDLMDGEGCNIGMTSAPCIVAPDYSDDWPGGSVSPFPGYAVYWFERYQLDDFTETLGRNGEVFFPCGVPGIHPGLRRAA